MRQQIKVRGLGYTLQDAKVTAYSRLKQQFKNNILIYGLLDETMVTMPKDPTMCTTENFPAKGTRKWITKHVVYTTDPEDATRTVKLDEADSKTEAVALARDLVLKHKITCTIKLERHLEDGQDIETIIAPKYGEVGVWDFVLDTEVVSSQLEDNLSA